MVFPDELVNVMVVVSPVLEVENWDSLADVVPRIGIEVACFPCTTIGSSEVVEAEWNAKPDALMHERFALPVNETGSLSCLHDAEAWPSRFQIEPTLPV